METQVKDIERFMRSYWGLTLPTGKVAQVQRDRERLGENEFMGRMTKAMEQHRRFMNNRFGKKVIGEYERLARKLDFHPNNDIEEPYRNLNAFVFSSGIINYHPVSTVLRSRETLRSLLGFLSQTQDKFTMIDLGSGDGKVTVGASLFLENLTRLYAVDYSGDAHNVLRENIRVMKESDKKVIEQKVTLVEADYRNPREIVSHLSEGEKKGADVVLVAYPFEGIFDSLNYAFPFVKPEGRIVVYAPSCSDVTVETQIFDSQLEGSKIRAQVFDHSNYFFDDSFLGVELKRSEH